MWTQTFDVSQQVDPEEYLAEICQLQQELARLRASLAQQLSADASTLNSAQGDLAATKAKLRAEQDAHQATREERNKLKRALAQRMKGTAATGVQAGETGAELDARAAAAAAEMKLLKASVISPDTDQGQELIKYDRGLRRRGIGCCSRGVDRLRRSVVQKDNRIEELETLLASTQAKLVGRDAHTSKCCPRSLVLGPQHKTSTDLAHECRLSLKMQTRLNAMDETKVRRCFLSVALRLFACALTKGVDPSCSSCTLLRPCYRTHNTSCRTKSERWRLCRRSTMLWTCSS